MSALVGVDVGGTFTDVVVWDRESPRLLLNKVPSTPADPSEGTVEGVRAALDSANLHPRDVAGVRHGTTVGTNTLIQRSGARTGLLTTRGFRDVLEIGRTKRDVTYDFFWDRLPPLVSRRYRREVGERTSASGEIIAPLNEAEVLREFEFLRSEGIESVAVSFLNAYANPDNERRAVELLRGLAPGIPITTGSEILPDLHEFERTSLAVANAYLAPAIATYLAALRDKLRSLGVQADVSVMQSNGGAMEIPYALEAPIRLLLSGPSAGVTGAAHVARALGFENLVTFDMGGTSCDVCLVEGGKAEITTRGSIAGYTLELLPILSINTIGAGGGSLAWTDAGGALKVGPGSAGAVPGPACYGLGGDRPTVTDAWVAVGLIGSASAVSRAVRIMPGLAERSLQVLAESLGLDVLRTAGGVLRVVEANMVNAVKSVSVKRGRDPKDLVLVAYGGAGPLAAAGVARELGMRKVLVPRHPGLTCALGTLVADIQYDAKRSCRVPLASDAISAVNGLLDQLIEQLTLRFPPVDRSRLRVSSEGYLRYRGQYHTLAIALRNHLTEGSVDELRLQFHQSFKREFGHARPDQPVEFDSVRVVVSREGEASARFAAPAEGKNALLGPRTLWLDGRNLKCSVWQSSDLGSGARIRGPAIIEEFDTTVWIPTDATAEIMADGSLLMEL